MRNQRVDRSVRKWIKNVRDHHLHIVLFHFLFGNLCNLIFFYSRRQLDFDSTSHNHPHPNTHLLFSLIALLCVNFQTIHSQV